VAGRAWKPMFGIIGFTLLVANFGSGMGSQIGAARLLYGMGRSNALPKSFFGGFGSNLGIGSTSGWGCGHGWRSDCYRARGAEVKRGI
jgi:hypothetical protein